MYGLIHSGIGEIVLDADIILNSDEESEYWKGIKLDVDDLAIDGNGHVIDACGKARIFNCTGKNVTIKNITLKNGFAEYSGGAIDNIGGELTIAGSLLTANTAGTDGGAIGNNEGKLMIAGCSLTGNSAQFDGGAICNEKGELKITGSTLTENTANSDGGAVYYYKSGLTIISSKFAENTASNGGAIGNRLGELTLHDSALAGNIANSHGGAIYLNKSRKYESENCTFKDNKPTNVYKNK